MAGQGGLERSFMSGEFVDANIVVYAHDQTAGTKQARARDLLVRLTDARTGRLSVQVLQEFYWIVTRKVPTPLKPETALEVVEDLSEWPVFSPASQHVVQAALLGKERAITFWDAMIVTAAIESGADTLWSEDLGDGARYEGVTVRNPFA